MRSEPVLGIDFGTTNSVCSVLSGGDPEILENSEGNRVTPSVVYYTQKKEQNMPLVGEPAENKAEENPERVIRSVKRKMGEADTITIPSSDGDGDDEYRVENIAADIIRKLRTDAADKLGIDREKLTQAVITTPAYWESDRKQAVIQAAKLAGFESVRTIKEPASAAIAYGRFEPGLNKTVGVYDLGGGTFDFAVVDVDVGTGNSGSEYNVVAQSGDPQLGGDDWDERIIEWIVSNFETEHSVNPLEKHHNDSTPYDHQIREERIRNKAREAKESLSNSATTNAEIRLPFLMEISGESVDIDMTLSQVQFESMTEDLLESTVEPMHTALDDAGFSVHDIDDIILVGGSTRMPQVSELVKSVFQQQPKQRVNPDEAVSAGAAIKGNKDNILLLEVTPLSLGIGIKGDRFKRMIERNERLPARTTEVFTTSNEGATAVRIPIYQGERDIASENRHLKTLIIEGMAPGSRHSAHIEVTFEVQQNGLINVQAVENTRNKSVNVELEGENQLPDEYIQDQVEEAKRLEEMDRRRQKVIEAQNDAQKALREANRLLSEFEHVFEGDEKTHVKKHITHVRNTRKDSAATLGELREATEDLNEWVLEIGDRVRRTGARNSPGPKKGPDTDPAAVDDTAKSTNTQTSGPGGAVSNTDTTVSDSNDAEDWSDTPDSESVPDETSSETTTATGDGFDVGSGVASSEAQGTGENADSPDETGQASASSTNEQAVGDGSSSDNSEETQPDSESSTESSTEAARMVDDKSEAVGDSLASDTFSDIEADADGSADDDESDTGDDPIVPDDVSDTTNTDSTGDNTGDETNNDSDSDSAEVDSPGSDGSTEVDMDDSLSEETAVSGLGLDPGVDESNTDSETGSDPDSADDSLTGSESSTSTENDDSDEVPVFGDRNTEKLEPDTTGKTDDDDKDDDDDDDGDDGTTQAGLDDSDKIGFS